MCCATLALPTHFLRAPDEEVRVGDVLPVLGANLFLPAETT